MDFLKKVVNEVEGASKSQGANSTESNGKTENNGANAILGAINGALGGGEKGEKKEGASENSSFTQLICFPPSNRQLYFIRQFKTIDES